MLGELVLVIAVVSIAYSFYKWATLNGKYFEKRNIKYMKPTFLVGNTGAIFTTKYTAVEFASKLYNEFPNESIYGIFDFRVPQFMIRDPEVIKKITVKDFDHFADHRSFLDSETDTLIGNSLFFMNGEKWRHMRATLSPAFTGSKMRVMFKLVSDCASDVVNIYSAKAKMGEVIDIEMKSFFSRYTTDVIASCAFGVKVNSFKNPENEFYVNGMKMLMNFASVSMMLRVFLLSKLPWIGRLFKLQLSEMPTSKFFKSMILDTMDMRKSQNIYRPDMINIMMQVREGTLKHQVEDKSKNEQDGFATVEESDIGKVSVTRKWTDDELVAQCFLFFAAGFDTTSTMLTFTSYELVANPDTQQKLYEEISETNEKIDGQPITYDVLQKMKYMDQVICEILRKWPPAPQSDRACVKDYIYDDGNYKFNVEKGISILIPILGLHRDEKYYKNPERFDPERFNDENKDSIIPGTYIPFGTGPRNCIGSRFALMELKAILYYLLLNFSFEVNAKTEIPINLVKSAFSLNTKNGMHLRLKPRT